MKWLKKKLLWRLPIRAQKFLMKKYLRNLSIDGLSDLTIRIANNKKTLDDSLRVLYESYQNKKLINKRNDIQSHATEYHLLPTTTVFIAYIGDRPVATISLFMNSEFGLPIEKICDLSSIYDRFGMISEVGSFAVIPEFQRMQGKLIFPMMAFMFRYAYNFKNVDCLSFSIHPEALPLYCGILQAELLSKKVSNYGRVNNAKAINLFLDLNNIGSKLKKLVYQDNKTLYQYFFEKPFEGVFNEVRGLYDDGVNIVFTEDEYRNFFSKITDIDKLLNPVEKRKIVEHIGSHFSKHLSEMRNVDLYRRKEPRYSCLMKGVLNLGDMRKVDVSIIDCSSRGIGIMMNNMNSLCKIGEQYSIDVKLSRQLSVSLPVKFRFKDGKKMGLEILVSDPHWMQFVDYLCIKYQGDSYTLLENAIETKDSLNNELPMKITSNS